ncbi:hypothetical protein Q1695_009079 [Nippostrongylus brasiliensis]|nr:hypothetical protein Q1695_009079 [Nippostrongylus brasiliensis]
MGTSSRACRQSTTRFKQLISSYRLAPQPARLMTRRMDKQEMFIYDGQLFSKMVLLCMGFVICVSLIVVAICLNALREQDLGVQSLVARRVPGNEKFVALLPCKEKLANQMYRLLSGYGIAKRLHRKLCILVDYNLYTEQVLSYYTELAAVFPNLHIDPIDVVHTKVPLAMPEEAALAPWKYEDPIKYIKHPSQILVMKTRFAQNVRYFEDYLPEIRQMLTFSPDLCSRGENAIHRMKMRTMDAMCVHTRVNDFEAFGWLASIESVFTASHLLAEKHNLSRYLIFGDSEHFMQRLAGMLNDHHAGEDRAMVSRNGVFEDMYLASRLCKAFLISSSLSTFGWFLAFFTQDQEAVYYMNDGRNSSVDIPYLRDFFL